MKQVTKVILSGYSLSNIQEILIRAKKLSKFLNNVDFNNPNTRLLQLGRGLCFNLNIKLDSTSLLTHYPNWSGSYNYPVKGGHMSPSGAYHSRYNLYCGAYGKRRINLLNWIIKEFQIAYDIKIKETK